MHEGSLLADGMPCGLREVNSLLLLRDSPKPVSRDLYSGDIYMADNTLEAILGKRTGVLTVKYQDFHLNYGSYLRLPVCLMHPRPGPLRLSPGGGRYR